MQFRLSILTSAPLPSPHSTPTSSSPPCTLSVPLMMSMVLLLLLLLLTWMSMQTGPFLLLRADVSAFPNNEQDRLYCERSGGTVLGQTWISNVTGCECECHANDGHNEIELICIQNCPNKKTNEICEDIPGQCCPHCRPIKPQSTDCHENKYGIVHVHGSTWRDADDYCQICHCYNGESFCNKPDCVPAMCQIHQKAVPGYCCDFNCIRSDHDKVINCTRSENGQVYQHGEHYISPNACVARLCRCLNGQWHCIDYCEPKRNASCLPAVENKTNCCRRCLNDSENFINYNANMSHSRADQDANLTTDHPPSQPTDNHTPNKQAGVVIVFIIVGSIVLLLFALSIKLLLSMRRRLASRSKTLYSGGANHLNRVVYSPPNDHLISVSPGSDQSSSAPPQQVLLYADTLESSSSSSSKSPPPANV